MTRARAITTAACMFLAAVAVIVAQHPGEPQPLGADEIVAVDITGVGDGRYVLEISGSVATVTPLTLLTVGPVPPGPGPGPGPEPSEFSKVVVVEVNKIAANDSRHAAALKLSKTYEMLADQTIPADKTVEAVNTIAKLALGSDAATWSGVTAVVNQALGKCTTEAAADAVLNGAASAIASTVPSSGDEDMAAVAERYGLDWEKFLSFLMDLLIKLLPLLIQI